MVRASVRFLLFTRTAAIIEIWVEHDTEPNRVKSSNTSLSLVSLSFFVNTPCCALALPLWVQHRNKVFFAKNETNCAPF